MAKRIRANRWNPLLFIVSPTLLWADYQKSKKEGSARVDYIKLVNRRGLIIALCLAAALCIGDFLSILTSFPSTVRSIFFLVVFYWVFSRCNEIFIAFVVDATSHLKGSGKTELKYHERISLALISYLELTISGASGFRMGNLKG